MKHMHPTVLLIDDNADTCELLRTSLHLNGYNVETASTGRDALYKLHSGLRPCVILMDLNMPVMTGFEFRQEQLRHEAFNDIPVIVYSGVVDVQENAQHLNAAAYAEKPLQLEELVSLVRRHCLK